MLAAMRAISGRASPRRRRRRLAAAAAAAAVCAAGLLPLGDETYGTCGFQSLMTDVEFRVLEITELHSWVACRSRRAALRAAWQAAW